MDIASLLGIVGAIGMILAAMIAGGGISPPTHGDFEQIFGIQSYAQKSGQGARRS
jgi:flagellar motor component MotA